MSVRAKMSPGSFSPGKRGAEFYLSAVYESDGELRKVSENAIFGDATPCGNLHISGDLDVSKFPIADEEYYVDLLDELPAGGAVVPYIVTLPVRKIYQSDQGNLPNVNFRFIIEGGFYGSLQLTIHNPHAIGWLDSRDHLILGLMLVRGRRSDVEIAARQRQLEQFDAEIEGGKSWYKDHPDSAKAERARRVKKLARAQGLEAEYTEGAS